MIGKTNTGSALKAFAIIGVTYPTGSVCTCTDGTKTLTLKDTSGLGIFLIPYAATWTVSCTDGTKTASKAVSITADGQSESVTLSYNLVLYSSSEDWQSNVGGYSSNEQVTVREENSELKMVFKQNGYGDNAVYDAYAYSNKPVDLTEYSISQISLRVIWGSKYINNLTIGFAKSQTGSFAVSKNLGSYGHTTSPNLDDTYSLDISKLSGNYYFCMRAQNGMNGLGTLYISEAIAE